MKAEANSEASFNESSVVYIDDFFYETDMSPEEELRKAKEEENLWKVRDIPFNPSSDEDDFLNYTNYALNVKTFGEEWKKNPSYTEKFAVAYLFGDFFTLAGLMLFSALVFFPTQQGLYFWLNPDHYRPTFVEMVVFDSLAAVWVWVFIVCVCVGFDEFVLNLPFELKLKGDDWDEALELIMKGVDVKLNEAFYEDSNIFVRACVTGFAIHALLLWSTYELILQLLHIPSFSILEMLNYKNATPSYVRMVNAYIKRHPI